MGRLVLEVFGIWDLRNGEGQVRVPVWGDSERGGVRLTEAGAHEQSDGF